ncbi:hypothetical protein GCM10007036_25350 [Alsobacter metallidurans]|uniref:Uncharacterized protein n=1 Tax=Alsobacter metallidurans TaxID=340221 RepID=A0A917I834_9HYPH|nr:hypothetical protein [Alsobacter metallidurans]GGH21228.1 hypothetical protein GCM10007036_25350 [Alsobacter metallidurans]
MIIKPDVEALLRKLLKALPLGSDADGGVPAPLPALQASGAPPAPSDACSDADLDQLLGELREWTAAMAWSTRPSTAVLDYVLLAANGRLTELFGEDLAPVRRQAILATCRDEAWRIIMDIRRAA